MPINVEFDISGILNSASTEIDELVSRIDDKVLTGYYDVSRAVIWLYISGFVAATLTALLGIRKTFFNGGIKLLLTFCVVFLSSLGSEIRVARRRSRAKSNSRLAAWMASAIPFASCFSITLRIMGRSKGLRSQPNRLNFDLRSL